LLKFECITAIGSVATQRFEIRVGIASRETIKFLTLRQFDYFQDSKVLMSNP